MTSEPDHCHLVHDDTGQPVASYHGQPLDEPARAAMLELVAAVHRMWDDMPADERAAVEARERNRARLAKIRRDQP